MKEERLVSYIQDVLISIHANIRDLKERKAFADPEELNYIEGRLFSYQEVVGIFKMSAREMGIQEDELGI